MMGSGFHSHGEPHVLKTADDRQAFPQTPEDRREPQSLRCHQRNSGDLRRVDHCSGVLGGHRQGFLYKNRFSGLGGRDTNVVVDVRRGHHHNRINIFTLQHLSPVGNKYNPCRLSKCLSRCPVAS